jgi:hypothetical protein
MLLFDVNDLDLFDDDQSSESSREKNNDQRGRPNIPLELPDLNH